MHQDFIAAALAKGDQDRAARKEYAQMVAGIYKGLREEKISIAESVLLIGQILRAHLAEDPRRRGEESS